MLQRLRDKGHFVKTKIDRAVAVIRPPDGDVYTVRRRIAETFLQGSGLEIGALHHPLPVPKGATVRYVDRLTSADLRQQYPELADRHLVDVDMVTNGESLVGVDDHSQDFVIANQFLEHTEDPIGTVKNMVRVLKPDGVLYLSIPDKTRTFDHKRPVTTLAHLRRDHGDGGANSRRAHFEEWSRLVNGETDATTIARQADENMANGYSIHYHVWDQAAFFQFAAALRQEWHLAIECEHFRRNYAELIFIFRKVA